MEVDQGLNKGNKIQFVVLPDGVQMIVVAETCSLALRCLRMDDWGVKYPNTEAHHVLGNTSTFGS